MHSLQPIHADSLINASSRGSTTPFCGLRGLTGRPVNRDSALMVIDAPGGHWLMSALLSAIATAYSRHLG